MLQVRELTSEAPEPWAARLRYAYADSLLSVGRREEAREGFARAADADQDADTDAAERLLELDGVVLEGDDDEGDDDEATSEAGTESDQGSVTDEEAGSASESTPAAVTDLDQPVAATDTDAEGDDVNVNDDVEPVRPESSPERPGPDLS